MSEEVGKDGFPEVSAGSINSGRWNLHLIPWAVGSLLPKGGGGEVAFLVAKIED